MTAEQDQLVRVNSALPTIRCRSSANSNRFIHWHLNLSTSRQSILYIQSSFP